MADGAAASGQRLDKWLWVARFFKSRTLATEAVSGGKVHCNGERCKPGRNIKPGDHLQIRKGIYEFDVVVLELAAQRLSAPLAAALYRETDEGRAAREMRIEQNRAQRLSQPVSDGRPDKRDRRRLLAVKNRQRP